MNRIPPNPYARKLPGPRVDDAWTVTAGVVVVIGRNTSITLPPGATWPGVDTLPEDWLEDLQPAEAVSATGSRWVTAQPADLPAGVVLVHAQMLRSGPLADRLARLDKLGMGNINQFVQSAAVNSIRESVSRMRGEMRRGG